MKPRLVAGSFVVLLVCCVAQFATDQIASGQFAALHVDRPWHLPPLLFVVAALAGIGIARGIAAGIVQYMRTRRALRDLLGAPRCALPDPIRRCAVQLGLHRRIDLIECVVPRVFCYGLIHPRIYLTTSMVTMLSSGELEAVLRHERHHLIRRDPLRTLCWTMLDGACWWAERGSATARLQRELSADRAVITAGRRRELASALLKVVTLHPLDQVAAPDLAASALSLIDARIDQMLQPDRMLPSAPTVRHRLIMPGILLALPLFCVSVMLHVAH